MEAQLRLGSMYEYGVGVPEDVTKAIGWYRKAAEKGDPEAAIRLADISGKEEVAPKSREQAVYAYQVAAEAGDAEAQMRIAAMHAGGKGVVKDAHYGGVRRADRDGAVIIPQEIIADVTDRVEEVLRTENKVRTAILKGVDPVDAYLQYRKF